MHRRCLIIIAINFLVTLLNSFLYYTAGLASLAIAKRRICQNLIYSLYNLIKTAIALLHVN